MKVLQISAQEPSNNSGGGIGVLQTLISLTRNNHSVDYIGPEIIDLNIKRMYNHCYELKKDVNRIRRFFNLIKGITNSRYQSWKKLSLDFNQYDVVVLDFTKLDYVVKEIPQAKLLVKVHNVEYDYSRNDYKKNKSLDKWLIAQFAYKQEKTILERADCILALTENDKRRMLEIYGSHLENKIVLNPVAVPQKGEVNKKKDSIFKMLITGSLWYGENADGVVWFVNNVFDKFQQNMELIVAGAKPSDSLKNELAKYENITLIDTPETMEPYFKNCDLFVAPVFSGAGMKVKVAEALSYGKPVIGTDHALLGYKIVDGENSFVANTADEFINKIREINCMKEEKWNQIQHNAKELFETEYSFDVSARIWEEAIISLRRNR